MAQFPLISSGICAVEASAGSGKTYQLALRFIQHILKPEFPPEENLRSTLALTFTNKASKEMKERILDFLKIAATAGYCSKAQEAEFLGPTGLNAQQAAARAKAAIGYLMHHYNYFQVQTINSFMKRMITGFAFQLNMSAAFEIQPDHTRYLRFCLDQAMERAITNPADAALFDEFMQQYLHLETHSGWFPKNTILEKLKEMFAVASSYGMPFATHDTTPVAELLKKRFSVHSDLSALNEMLPEKTNATFRKTLGKYLTENTIFSTDDLENWLYKESVPVNKGCEIPEPLAALWDAIRRQVRLICLHEAHTSYNTYIALYNRIEKDLHTAIQGDDMLLLAEIDRHTNALFAPNPVALPELYFRLAAKFRHYLLDEFQDTNTLQWNNLSTLIDEALACNGSLFFVGDKKQAIYRFRGGTTELFDEVPRQFLNRCVAERKTLAINWRSEKEIVDFNNAIFNTATLRTFISCIPELKKSAVELAPGIIEDVAAPFAQAKQTVDEKHDKGRVCVYHPQAEDAEEYFELLKPLLLTNLNKLRERFEWKDIAILARKNDQLAMIGEWLLEAAIPARSERMLDIRQNHLVKEVLSLLAFLRSPINDLAFASFISGTIFAQATGKDAALFNDFVFKARRENEEHSLYTTFRKQYTELWEEHLQPLFFSAGYVPLYELCTSILGRFNVTSLYPNDTPYLIQLLECIKYYEDNQHSTSEDFFTFINGEDATRIHISAGAQNAVTLMTIHKSKGLEFPALLLPCLAFDTALAHEGSAASDIYCEDNTLSITRLKKVYGEHDEALRAALMRKQAKVYSDELNTLYVALTRPRNELYAYIMPKNCLRTLIPEQEHGAEHRYATKETVKGDSIVYTPAKYSDWVQLLQYEFMNSTDPRQHKARLRGTTVHYALSLIGNVTNNDSFKIISAAARGACARFPGIIELKELETELERIVSAPKLSKFFKALHAEVYCEKEFSAKSGAVLRVDRLLVSSDTVTILDFKATKVSGPAYAEQVRQYMLLAKELYPGKAVRGYLVYQDLLEAEEVNI